MAAWNDIPAAEKSTDSTWYGDYGGYVAIGYDSKKVKIAPTSFKDLLKPAYKHEVAINGNPTEASAAFSAVYAAALANGGSLGNINPGIAYFARLKKAGNFVPVTAGPTTVQSGQTPIVVWWDYLLASEVGAANPDFKIVIPSDASYAAYYDQAINASAPRPGGGAAVGGVPVLGHRPEPVAAGQGPPGRAADDGRERDGRQGRERRPAARPVGHAAVPDPGPGVGGRGSVVAKQWAAVVG